MPRVMFVVTLLSLLLVPLDEPRAAKYALVVGNANYGSLSPLPTTLNNVDDLTEELSGFGFGVTSLKNATKPQLQAAIDQFLSRLSTEDTALVYLGGHGVQIANQNWFVTVEAKGKYVEDFQGAAISITDLVRRLGARNEREAGTGRSGDGPSLIFLDACSDPSLRSRSGAPAAGLTRMAVPPNTLAIYAADFDQLASAGFGRNTLYIESLLAAMRANRKARLSEMLIDARNSVMTASYNDQRPIELGALREKQYRLLTDSYGPLELFRDCPTCPELIVVPSGKFEMGSSRNANEQPVHPVVINEPFALGRYEVTVEEWKRCVGNGACRRLRSGADERLPATGVSYDDTVDFTRWLQSVTDIAYRLPTEPEWEYAARAGTLTAYPWGDSPNGAPMACADCTLKGGPVAVDRTWANPFKLAGMNGNMWEWVDGDLTESYAPGARLQAGAMVLRGGGFEKPGLVATSTFRGRARVGQEANRDFGFRVARDLVR